MGFRCRQAALLCLATLLAGCAHIVPPAGSGRPSPRPAPTAAPTPRPAPVTPVPAPSAAPGETAITAGLTRGPDIAALLPSDKDQLARALRAFRTSCPALIRRTDQSDLTSGSDWQGACAAASSWSDAQAGEFFRRYFEAVGIGNTRAYATGYYEPEIAGCRAPMTDCAVPLYRTPPDLISVDLGLFSDELKGKSIRGKV